jgi:RNA polymerase sigma-70 factor, ECF subfamily
LTTHGHRASSDAWLVRRVAEGDVRALAVLYDRHARVVYAFAAHAIGKSDAEEVVQEVFVRLWRRAAQFDLERGAFSTWLMAIARNHVVDQLRRRQRGRIAAGQIEEVLMNAVDPAAGPEEEVVGHTASVLLAKCLRELPAEQRRVLTLAYFGGLSQSEIAHALDLPLGTVKKRTRLALQKLRASLAQHDPEVRPTQAEVR